MTRTLALLLVVAAVTSAKVPISKYFDLCKRNQSSEMLSKCVTKSIEKARPYLIKGIPELKLLPLEPLFIDKMEFTENSGRFKFTQTLTNVSLHGLGAYIIKDLKIDLDKLTWEMSSLTPKSRMEASYEMDGQILVVPIKGSGKTTYNFTEVLTTDIFTFKKVKKNNKIHLSIDTHVERIEPKGLRVEFTNLFNGDKRLGDTTNAFLNENWYEAFNTYRSLPEKAFGEFTRNQAERILSRYSMDELFPE